jgi:hypothetical protein
MPTLREKIDFLLKSSGEVEAGVLAKALEIGITLMYDEAIVSAYLDGVLSRQSAMETLGNDRVMELDYAIKSLGQDVAWGLSNDK